MKINYVNVCIFMHKCISHQVIKSSTLFGDRTFTVLSMDIFLSVYFYSIVILNYCLFSSLLVFFITLIICCLCLHCCLFELYCFCMEAPNTKTNSLCVQTHLAIKLFLILILILTHTCGFNPHLNTWAKYRKYII